MSQSTLPEKRPSADTEGKDTVVPQDTATRKDLQSAYELDYHPMPVMAPVALFLGISSFAALMGLFGLILAVVGILVSIGCWLQIRASQGHLSGSKMAIAGGLLSAGFLALGSSLMLADYRAELPEGYQRVNFPSEIAEKGFVTVEGERQLHPDVEPLIDQPLFLKGYIWESQSYKSGFILLKDNGKCCFGGNPAPNDMIYVELEPGTPFRFIPGLVSVTGEFHANPNAGEGDPVYSMNAKYVTRAKTVF